MSEPIPAKVSLRPDLSERSRTGTRDVRVAMYSHDAVGLGHLRRNLLLAGAMTGSGCVDNVLMITGASEANLFAKPRGVDFLTLPSLQKRSTGYEARSFDIPFCDIQRVRAKTMDAALEAFRPDVFIVDKVPRGVEGELIPTLTRLRDTFETVCVLGLRDVLDAPGAVRREWRALANQKVVQEYYDAVWVYGDKRVYDPIEACDLPIEIANEVIYTGYLDRRSCAADGSASRARIPSRPYALCTVGGGHDGEQLAQAFAAATLPGGMDGVLLTGPFMSPAARAALHALAKHRSDLDVVEFLDEPTEMLRHATRVVCMGGYNTLSEVLSFEKRALVVPRVTPRTEQQIRAHRLRDLGMVDVLEPALATSKALEAWLARDVPQPVVHGRVDFGGLARIPNLVASLASRARSAHALQG